MKKDSAHIDLLVRYDPKSGRLLIYDVVSTIESGKINALGDRAKLEVPIESIRSKEPEEAERAIGACILATLDFYNDDMIGVRDYQEIVREHDAELRPNASQADPEAQFALAMEHISLAMKNYSPKDIQSAETYLRWASAHGSTAASEYLQTQWERIKEHLQRKGAP